MSSGSSIVICMVASPPVNCLRSTFSGPLGPVHPALAHAQRLGMLRYLVLARRRVPALRRGHAILLFEENVFRARQTFAARGGDRPWTFPPGFISTQGLRGHPWRS